MTGSISVNIRRYSHESKETSDLSTDGELIFDCGNINCVLGRSGAGKSTLLRIICGLASGAMDGAIKFDHNGQDRDLEYLTALGLIAYVSDQDSLLPWLTVEQNSELPKHLSPEIMRRRPAIDDRCHLDDLGLASCRTKRPSALSFGMKRRAMLARALGMKPSYLLLDEALTGVDVTTRLACAKALSTFVERERAVCLLVTHEPDLAKALNSCIWVVDPSSRLIYLGTNPSYEQILVAMNSNSRSGTAIEG